MANIEQYLEYIGLLYQPNRPATIDHLTEVVAAHLAKFSYQNTELYLQGLLDVKVRKPVDVSIDSTFNQFIVNKGSGYCYQNNELLAWALEKLGFKLNRYLAKVIVQFREKINESDIKNLEFSHETLIVDLSEDKWLIDTGFANNSLRRPLKIIAGEQELIGDKYNLSIDETKLRLETYTNQGWFCLFDVDLTPKSINEISIANQTLFTSQQKIPIRDEFYKLAVVTPTKRKTLCVFKESHVGFFKSISGNDYKKEKEIKTEIDLCIIANKKFGIELDEEIAQSIFKNT